MNSRPTTRPLHHDNTFTRPGLRHLTFAVLMAFGALMLSHAAYGQATPTAGSPAGHGLGPAECYVVADSPLVNGGDQEGGDDVFFGIVDLSTGHETSIGFTGTLDIEAMAYDAFTGTLFAADANTLGIIDQGTGVFTPFPTGFGSGDGTFGPIAFDDVDGLAVDPYTGVLYGSVRLVGQEDLLIQIDKATGQAVPDAFGTGVDYVVVPHVYGRADIDDLAFDPFDGALFGSANADGNFDHLVQIDKLSGLQQSKGAILDDHGVQLNDFEGLTSTPGGTIIGVRGGNFKQIYRIRRQDAQALLLSTLTKASDYEAISCNVIGGVNTIEGTVFEDHNADGFLDGGDTGAPGISVRLYRDVNQNGQVDGSDILLLKQDSGAGGAYAFTVAATGKFVLDVDESDLPTGNLLTTDNVETASFSGFGQTDTGNDFGFASLQIDLELRKTVDVHEVDRGDQVTFTLTLKNKGPNDATGVSVEDQLPAGLEFVSSSGNYDANTGIWDVGDLPSGNTVSLDVVVRAKATGNFINTAEVFTADQPDLDSTPNNGIEDEDDQDSARLKVNVKQEADLSLEKTVDNAAPSLGDNVVFTITVTNHGPVDATHVLVIDPLPNGLVLVDASAGQGSFDESNGVWNVGTLTVYGTATLYLTVRVDLDPENCAEVYGVDQYDPDSTPNNWNRSEDDMSCQRVTIGDTSGGGDAGIESDGDMATQLARRLFNRREDALVRRALEGAPVPQAFTAGATASFAAGKIGSGVTNLASFVPDDGPQQSHAYDVTPSDLLGITNATSVFAVDYLRPEGRRLAALFGATSPSGVLYDHTKNTCDRLGGGYLEDVGILEVDGHPFVLSKLVHADGATDYAVSFVAYETATSFVVDSRFTQKQYAPGVATDGVVNMQVWSVAPEYTSELVSAILDRMAAVRPLSFANDDAVQLPQVYVRSGSYSQGRLSLSLVNHVGATDVVVKGSVARTETDAGNQVREPFERVVSLPAPTGDDDVSSLALEVGPVYDVALQVRNEATNSLDEIYYADGVWSYANGEKSYVDVFETYAEPAVQTSDDHYVVERDAYLSGNVTDWVSLFRYLRPGGHPIDLSAYDDLSFKAYGQGRVHMVVEKASIDDWDQYSFDFTLPPQANTFTIPFAQLKKSGGSGIFTGEDVTSVVFYVSGDGYSNSRFDLVVSDLAFGKAETTVANEDPAELPAHVSLAQNYPNPFNPATHITFDLPEAMHVRVAVYDMLGRQVAVPIDGMLPAGNQEVTFDAADLPSGTYVYRLETPAQTLTRKMVLLK